MELDGTILARFGKAGKAPKELSTLHQMDCRNPDEIFSAEIQQLAAQRSFCARKPDDHPDQVGDFREALSSVVRRGGAGVGRLVTRSRLRTFVFDANPDFLKHPTTFILRSGRRGTFQGTRVRLHAHGSPYATLGGFAHLLSRRLPVVRIRPGRKIRQRDRAGRLRPQMPRRGVRVDAQDNIWVVDAGSNQVLKFDPDGRTIPVVFGREA